MSNFIKIIPEKKKFIFPDVKDKNITTFLKTTEINSIEFYPEKKYCLFYLESEKIMNTDIRDDLSKLIQKNLQIDEEVFLRIKYNNDNDVKTCVLDHWDDIINKLTHKKKSLAGLLDIFNLADILDDTITIEVKNEFAQNQLYEFNMNELISTEIQQLLNKKFKIKFVPGSFKNEIEKINKFQKKQMKEEIYKIETVRKKKFHDVIYGKRIVKKPDTIKSVLSKEKGNVVIKGKIYNIDTKKREKKFVLYSIYVYDGTDSIITKIFLNPGQTDIINKIESLEINDEIIIQGAININPINKEIGLDIKSINNVDKINDRLDNAPEKRIEFHLHSCFSDLDALTKLKSIVDRAAKWEHKAVAVTDHGNIHIFPKFYKYCKKKNVKPIFGMEGYLTRKFKRHKSIIISHITIIVQNKIGLKNLYKLVSESHLNYFYKKPLIPIDVLMQYREGLLLGSACENGEIFKGVFNKLAETEMKETINLYDFFEIMPVSNNKFMLSNMLVKSYIQLQDINKQIYKLGKKYNKLVIATGDVHFLEKDDSIFRSVLQCGMGYKDYSTQSDLYYRTTEEMLNEFDYFDEQTAKEVVITNTNKLADMIEDLNPIPEGFYPPVIDNAEEEVKKEVHYGLKKYYGDKPDELIIQKLDKEIHAIIDNGFSVLYLSAIKLVRQSLKKDYPVGSRGSVGSSLAAFLSGISEVNPLPPHYRCPKCYYTEFKPKDYCGVDLPSKKCPKCDTDLITDGYNIPFETFMGFEGNKVPDIDLNFSGEIQLEIHNYAEKLFGKQNVFRAGTINTLQSKTIEVFSKEYFEKQNKVRRRSETVRFVKGIEGIKRTTGQHPGGLVIIPNNKEIYDFTPIQYPSNDASKGVRTTHFEYHDLEDQLVKLDLLGHDNPTFLKYLSEYTGKNIDDIPLNDIKTLKIFSSITPLNITNKDYKSAYKTGTLGIPEMSTGFVLQMLADTRPKTFEELVRISGLSHGTNVWLGNGQSLIKNKTATLKTLITCRDDIMLNLINKKVPELDAFTIMEQVRKGKGLTDKQVKLLKKHKVSEWYIESCQKIAYLFPKAHAVAYVIMSVKISYFKVHYPVAFYAAYFSINAEDFDSTIAGKGIKHVQQTIETLRFKQDKTQKDKKLESILQVVFEMYCRDIELLPVDIYKSDTKRFHIEDGKIRPALCTIPGLGITAAQNIVEARVDYKFKSIEDLTHKTRLNKTVIAALKDNDCLSDLPDTNQLSLF